MIRVCLCDPRPKARSALRQAVERLAADAGATPLATNLAASPAQAVDDLRAHRAGYCALLLVNADFLADADAAALSGFKQSFPETRLVLMSGMADAALQAYRVNADAFAFTGNGTAELVQVLRGQLSEIAMQRGATITLRSKAGIDVLDANRVLFAETSDGGPVIHLTDGRDIQMRGTLQGLYGQMSHDARFAKAGGSFIVNLDNVRSAGKSSIVFPDGSVIIVPIRARKPFHDALAAYRAGA